MTANKQGKTQSNHQTTPSKNILDFFQKRGAASGEPSSTKKPKSAGPSRQLSQRNNAFARPSTAVIPRKAAQLCKGDEKEIIVISDSDDEEPGPSARPRKAPALKRVHSTMEDLGNQLHGLSSRPSNVEEEKCEVYLPLLPRTSEPGPSSSSRPFGNAVVFDLTGDEPEELSTTLPTLKADKSFDVEAHDVCSLPDPEDKYWADNSFMDDSQDALAFATEGGDEVANEAAANRCRESTDSSSAECPICLLPVALADMQSHVNACLDSDVPEPTLMPNSSNPVSKSSAWNKSAFADMMLREKEIAAWKAAELDDAPASVRKAAAAKGKAKDGEEAESKRPRRKAPFFKVMEGMPIAVDAFRYGALPGVTAYFLSHAHSDHYTSLSKSWKNGPIYCSQTTANLIHWKLKVEEKWIHPLPVDTPTILPNTGGVEVTLISANHCPGSSLFLFSGPQTINAGDAPKSFQSPHIGTPRVFRYLHCGDFRACPSHTTHAAIAGKKLDLVYLDTTYLDPKYCFPPQRLVIDACAELAKEIALPKVQPSPPNAMSRWLTQGNAGDKTKDQVKEQNILFVVGTYSVGKERIFKGIAEALGAKIYCDHRKRGVLSCDVDDPDLLKMLTNDPLRAAVHVVPLWDINAQKMQEYLARWNGKFTRVVAIRPTGWTYSPPKGTLANLKIPDLIARDQGKVYSSACLAPSQSPSSTCTIYGVPYSEHSSFFELTCFALSTDWVKMIPTVNVGNEASRAKMKHWFDQWALERRRRNGVPVPHRTPDYW